jgi:hypothetical protein
MATRALMKMVIFMKFRSRRSPQSIRIAVKKIINKYDHLISSVRPAYLLELPGIEMAMQTNKNKEESRRALEESRNRVSTGYNKIMSAKHAKKERSVCFGTRKGSSGVNGRNIKGMVTAPAVRRNTLYFSTTLIYFCSF